MRAKSRHLNGAASTLAQELEREGEALTENQLYEALAWLGQRQARIEQRLSANHLHEGCVVLYDMSGSYDEGRHGPLARFGANRDHKRGKPQINDGVLANAQGCPVAVEVYPGNTSDSATVADQLAKLREGGQSAGTLYRSRYWWRQT